MREHWELDLSPISNLQLTLEENGMVITGFDTVDRKIDALSQQTLIDDGNIRKCCHILGNMVLFLPREGTRMRSDFPKNRF